MSLNRTEEMQHPAYLRQERAGGNSAVGHARRGQQHWISLRTAAPFALALGTLTVLGYAALESSQAVLMAYLFFGLAGLALVLRGGTTPVRIYLTVYGLAAVAAILLAYIFSIDHGVPYWAGGSDELRYEEVGMVFARQFGVFDYAAIRGGIVHEWHNSVGYIYLVGLLVWFSEVFDGFHTMVPRLFNAACLGLCCAVIYAMGLRLGLQRKTATRAALFTGCLPIMMWVSVQTLRDIVQTLNAVTLVFLWLPDQRGRWRYSIPVLIALSVLLLIPMMEMRRGQALAMLLFMAITILFNRGFPRSVLLVCLSTPIFLAIPYLVSEFYAMSETIVQPQIDDIGRYSLMRVYGTGGGLSAIVFQTPLFPFGWMLRTGYALVSPLPVDFKTLDTAWLSLGTLVQIFFLPFLLMGLRKAVMYTAGHAVATAFVLMFFGMAMLTFTSRHITQFMPFGILLVALGYEQYSGNPRHIWFIMAVVVTTLGMAYVFLKGP